MNSGQNRPDTERDAAPGLAAVAGLPAASGRKRALAYARTCYDHLAGTVGVAVTDAMTGRGLLDWERGLRLTPLGREALGDCLGLTLPGP